MIFQKKKNFRIWHGICWFPPVSNYHAIPEATPRGFLRNSETSEAQSDDGVVTLAVTIPVGEVIVDCRFNEFGVQFVLGKFTLLAQFRIERESHDLSLVRVERCSDDELYAIRQEASSLDERKTENSQATRNQRENRENHIISPNFG